MSHPWSTLQAVFDQGVIESLKPVNHPHDKGDSLEIKNAGAPVKPGDTIILMTGYHGSIYAVEYYNPLVITIRAGDGQTPRVGSLELRSGCNWHVKGLSISPSHDPVYGQKLLATFSSHGWTGPSYNCTIENCRLFSVEDSSSWSVQDWNDLSCTGLSLPGDGMKALGNILKNVNFGITVSGDHCTVARNVIENFSGDGMRGLGDFGTFEYNTVKNCYDVNANHDDGFQSWSYLNGQVGISTVYNITLRGNLFINRTDPNQPHPGALQGIGCFDGMFENWIIENNVVVTDHWHGITLLGAVNCRIVNNTVVDLNDERPGPAWIRIDDHKNGTPSSNCVIRNNLATSVSYEGGVTADHNLLVTWDEYPLFFKDFAHFDLRLKYGCPAIDSGSALLSPLNDHLGRPRPQGRSHDIGAFEFSSSAALVPVRYLLDR